MPTLQNFRDNFFGVRPNRFLVIGGFPSGVSQIAAEDLRIYVKAADAPGSTIGAINVAWQGRIVKFAGERVYADWAINVYESNAPAKDLRAAFEQWMELLDGRNTHQINYNLATDWVVYYSDIVPNATATSLPTQDVSNFSKAIKLKNCFPVDIGPVTLNYDMADSFSEFTVQIAYDYWEPADQLVGPPAPEQT
jgi:hypothetical protein